MINAGGVAGAAWYGVRAAGGRLSRFSRWAGPRRRREAYDAHANFVAELGLSPAAVLGSPPAR